MQQAPAGGASTNGRSRPFSASERKRVLGLVVGRPSGTIVSVGGLEFDLVAISSSELISVLDVIVKIGDTIDRIAAGTFKDSEMFTIVGQDGGTVMKMLHDVLKRSAIANGHLDENDPGGAAVFEEWFAALPVVETLKTVGPKILDANGIKIDRPTRPTVAEGSTRSTPANTSSPDTPGPHRSAS